ncbi:hypothetical protein [Algoriphagus namhaensis]
MESKPEESRADLQKTREELTWLENLQRNSWEPEVIISGIILAFLFAFPSKIYAFSAMLIQDLGLNFLGAILVLFYLTAVISVFKIFFVVHLALRFVWAGLLGLSYAFPEGVVKKNLFANAQDYEYRGPGDLVLQMERTCSMTFAYPISLVFNVLVFTTYLAILLFAYIWLNISFFIVYLFFVFSLLGFAGLSLMKKKTKWKTWYATSMMGSVGAIYQSNLGKWFTIFYGLGIFALSGPLIYHDVRDFSLFFNEADLLENELLWPTKELSYTEYHDPDTRYPRVFMPGEVVDAGFLRLGVARYEGDDRFVKDINKFFKSDLDSMGWHPLEDTPDLYRFSIEDQVYPADTWRRNRVQGTDQKVYETTIPIEDLSPGTYTLRVEKLVVQYGLFSNKPEEIKLRAQWDEIDFIKK